MGCFDVPTVYTTFYNFVWLCVRHVYSTKALLYMPVHMKKDDDNDDDNYKDDDDDVYDAGGGGDTSKSWCTEFIRTR